MARPIADQTVEELGGPGRVLARQRRDHQELDRLLRELAGTTGRAQLEVLRRINRLVVSHAVAAETVLRPVLRRSSRTATRSPSGSRRSTRRSASWSLSWRPWRTTILAARAAVRMAQVLREDVRDEEDVLFPRLQERHDGDKLRRFGRQWQVARRISPTRPRP